MMHICRAEDGQTFQVNITLWELERRGTLEKFLSEETGIEADDILAYLPDGRRLRNENIRDLAGAEDQKIYVFNKGYLDVDLDIVLQKLRLEAPLQPLVEENTASTPPLRPSHLGSSYLRTAHIHHEEVNRTLIALRHQYDALRIASSSLDFHVLSIQEAFESVTSSAERELQKQESLLTGLEADLEIIQHISVHREFLSEKARKAIEAGDPVRTLGAYVSGEKMRQVAGTCERTHNDLRDRTTNLHTMMTKLRDGTDMVRALVSDTSPIEDAEVCNRRSHELSSKMSNVVAALEKPNAQTDRLIQEMRQLDGSVRSELQRITQLKNTYTESCISGLRQISELNTYLVQLPSTMSSLQSSFRVKTSFSHIQRLHNMVYAYGATVVEIVRRKEFSQFFYQRAQNILEVMTKMSANERKRRQVFRSEVHGQLPFETKGLDEPVPSIEFSSNGASDLPYTLERADINDMLLVLHDLEHFCRESSHDVALASVREARVGLDKLIQKMDGLEAGFDRIAERSLLSASRLLEHRRHTAEEDEKMMVELQSELQHQEQQFEQEKRSLQDELTRLRSLTQETERVQDQHERELRAVRAQLESETNSRRILERRNGELSEEADSQRTALASALSEATERTHDAERLRQELAQVRAEFDEMKDWERKNTEKTNGLLEDQMDTLRRLDEARSRGEDLEAQIQAARRESDEVKRALADAGKEKDRLLRAQASEHDRIMRDHIAEADGDRAVLEHQYQELKAALEDAQRQLKDARAQTDMSNSDAVGLREELQRVEHELREARHTERVLRDDLRAGRASQSDFEQKQEDSGRLIAQMLDVALAFRESHVKALLAVQTMTSHPSSSVKTGTSPSMSESAFGGLRRSVLNHTVEPPPIDPSDPAAAVEALRAFDHDVFLEAVNKAGQTIRKWQKQCKDYREKAKGKISFRNFTKGDLALFLPTRNSVTKPWAAFNVSFPHYFLKATGHLEEQLKTREWIVARITSITEGVVDNRDPNTNPYGLGDGVKYYMLEVEDWTQPASTPKPRRVSTKKQTGSQSPRKSSPEPPSTAEATPEPTPGPPDLDDAEVEEGFPARSPTSPLTTALARASSPSAAGPSSLSRLLAQASDSQTENIAIPQPDSMHPFPSPPASSPREASPLPQHATPPPPSPSHTQAVSPPRGTMPLPGRPGSRASRISVSSRFSGGRIPFGGVAGSAKAVATTALASDPTLAESPTSNGSDTASASPEGSPTDGMAGLLPHHRRRASSYHPKKESPLVGPGGLPTIAQAADPVKSNGFQGSLVGSSPSLTARVRLASLASSWGVPFGRRKPNDPSPPSEISGTGANGSRRGGPPLSQGTVE
ncbi:putative peripheral membrane protein [Trametopsis cervina]|nr:putative peripheral membrane protein [Trametopsis cervina]